MLVGAFGMVMEFIHDLFNGVVQIFSRIKKRLFQFCIGGFFIFAHLNHHDDALDIAQIPSHFMRIHERDFFV